MQKLIIKGKRYLNGKILISGSKNATLPILAACILSNDIKLQNIPLVKDIFTMVELLEFIGLKVKISKKQNTLEILNNSNKINYTDTVKLIIKEDGISGLFGRGLKTRILTNGIQGIVFTISWRYFEDKYFKK